MLEARGESRERRDQLTHPPYQKPELPATKPNQLWSWDITKLRGPVKWTHYNLYVILDVFNRFVVGWMIAYREKGKLAKRLIDHSCKKQLIERDHCLITPLAVPSGSPFLIIGELVYTNLGAYRWRGSDAYCFGSERRQISGEMNLIYGFHAATGAYEDLVKAGFLDPTKVTHAARQNPSSI